MAKQEIATLGGGCFWCLEAVFDSLRGVEHVESGYAGGMVDTPTYQQVCSGSTGHAEVVQITFKPDEIAYRDLLEIFFVFHDPTTRNRQGADVGTQYRSVIFYHSPEQQQLAEQVMREFNDAKVWPRPIVTELVPSGIFYPAEAYHQGYFRQHTAQPYCQAVIAPKVAKLRQKFASRLR